MSAGENGSIPPRPLLDSLCCCPAVHDKLICPMPRRVSEHASYNSSSEASHFFGRQSGIPSNTVKPRTWRPLDRPLIREKALGDVLGIFRTARLRASCTTMTTV